MGRRVKDLSGQKFGRLTVIERVEDYIYIDKNKKSSNKSRWLCKCDCNGNEKKYLGRSLIIGYTKSCGCLVKENMHKRLKKYNTYDLSGEYGIGYTLKGEEFYFDLEDYNLIKDYCWKKDKNGYIETTDSNHCHLRMQRIVMNAKKDEIIDHINHEVNNNRKYNLRRTNRNQNAMNSILRKDNKYGVKGVRWDEKHGHWYVYIQLGGKPKHLGTFKNFDEAMQTRKEAEEKYYGEFSYDNSMKLNEINNSIL